jgi:ferric-dicitrate binding protein FerR (iron transport regulator)
MTANDNNLQSRDVSDQNIERLLRVAYDPESPRPEFAAQVRQRMQSAAQRAKPAVLHAPVRRFFIRSGIAAAVLAIVCTVIFMVAQQKPRRPGQLAILPWVTSTLVTSDNPTPPAASNEISPFGHVGDNGLVAWPHPPAPAAKPEPIGSTIQTKHGERRRVCLADGSVLYVNQDTRLAIDGERRVSLAKGEIFVEVSPRHEKTADAQDAHAAGKATFVVSTPRRSVTALGTKFDVRHDRDVTNVLVTQGKVAVSDYAGLLYAGRQLTIASDGDKIAQIPRASAELEWTRDLVAAAESPLVPQSEYCGGALLALDPNGQEARLSLRQYHVDVHIEDGFARTTIDQTYFNHLYSRLEGTFYFPLPPDASISRLAMYVDGKLMEGGMAEREHARYVFEDIMYTRRDPALLEWVDGSTFKMRVFPLEGRQEKRIILSYAQRLDSLGGHMSYRFPGGHSMPLVDNWSFHARLVGGGPAKWACNRDLTDTYENADLLLDAQAQQVRPIDDVALEMDDADPQAAATEFERFSRTRQEGYEYLMLRYRPVLADKNVQADRPPPRRDWVFLFESSGDRQPLLARAQIDIIKTLLGNAQPGDRFAVLSAGTHVRTLADEYLPVSPAAVEQAVKFMETTHLVGALDLEGALSASAKFLREGENAHLVYVGGGIAVLGKRETADLVKLIPPGSRYVGVGVGKRFSREFMKEAAGRTGGFFCLINPDENIAWKAGELSSTLNAPRLMDIRVSSGTGLQPVPGTGSKPVPPESLEFLSFADSISEGEEICVVARYKMGDSPPAKVTINGSLNGQDWSREIDVGQSIPQADYLPRFWAKLEIDRLLAAGAQENHNKIVELSKAMYVMSPFTSLLVLENDAMYTQYNVDRGRKDHWAMYPAPAQIKVATELEPGRQVNASSAAAGDAKPTAQQVLQTIYLRVPPNMLYYQNYSPYAGQTTTVWQMLTYPSYNNGDYYWEYDKQREGRYTDAVFTHGRFGARFSGQFSKQLLDTSGFVERNRLPIVSEALPAVFTTAGTMGRPQLLSPADSLRQPLGLDFSKEARRDLWVSEGRGDSGGIGMGGALSLRELSPGMPNFTARGISFDFATDDSFFKRQLGRRSELDRLKWTSDLQDSLWVDLKRLEGKEKLDYQAGDALWRLSQGYSPQYTLYQRPNFSNDQRLYTDLLMYAEGMNTSWDDIQAAAEAEAKADKPVATGRIDEGARALIDSARAAGWQAAQIAPEGSQRAYSVRFDGAGRCVYRRLNEYGLKEQVICDGGALYHIYDELGLGAKRTLSRFHRRTIQSLLPMLAPPADDLALGCDVLLTDKNTVAVVPIGAKEAKDADGKPQPYVQLEMVFKDGRLAERRLSEMPSGKLLARQTYSADGQVTNLDGNGKVVDKRTFALAKADAPSMEVDKDLVVLPLPFRTSSQVYQAAKRPQDGRYQDWSSDDALAMLGAYTCERNTEALRLIQKRFFAKGDRRLGFLTLLLTNCGQWAGPVATSPEGKQADIVLDVDGSKVYIDPTRDHPGSPLARYVEDTAQWVRRGGNRGEAELYKGDDFVSQLWNFGTLYYRWNGGGGLGNGDEKARKAQRDTAYEYIRDCKSPAHAYALLTVMGNYNLDAQYCQAMTEACAKAFARTDGFNYAARYEAARWLYKSGNDAPKARALFQELFDEALANDLLPRVDGDFRNALTAGPDPVWSQYMHQAAERLVKKDRRGEVVILASQCVALGDPPIAEDLLNLALDGLEAKQKLPVTLAAVEFLYRGGNYARADSLLAGLLEDTECSGSSVLWRLAAQVSSARNRTAEALARQEKAMDLEYAQAPGLINLQVLRNDFGTLLGRYEQLTQALATLQSQASGELTTKVIRAADRWRAMDPDDTQACQYAARIFQTLGQEELAWEYLTTPLADKPNEAAPWASLAGQLKQQGAFGLADRAYASAFECEKTNAQILWDRAQLLQQQGRTEEAKAIYRQISEGTWPRQYNWIQAQAKQYLGRS